MWLGNRIPSKCWNTTTKHSTIAKIILIWIKVDNITLILEFQLALYAKYNPHWYRIWFFFSIAFPPTVT